MSEDEVGPGSSEIPATIEIDSGPNVQPELSGEPSVIHVNSGPQVSGGQLESTNATATLVLGIVGMMTALGLAAMCCFGPNLCLAIPALVLGNADRAKMLANPHHPDKGMIQAANVLNWIGVIIGVLGIFLYVIFFIILGVASSGY
jgi:hypothetical protein